MTGVPSAAMLRADPFVRGLGFPESPRWHDDALWLSDIACRRVLVVDSRGVPETVCEVSARPSGLGWLPDGRLLVVAMEEPALLRLDANGLVCHADLSTFAYAGTMNDMVVDAAGTAYIGQFGYDAKSEPPRAVGLVRVSADGVAREEPVELFRPNGCVLTPDGRSLIVAETHLGRISVLRVTEDGGLRDRRTYAQLPSGSWADGICLDAEGAIWASDPIQQRCVRVLPGNVISHAIDTAPHACVACMLGGPDGTTLYLTVATLGGFDDRARRLDGGVDVVEVEVPQAGRP